MHLFFRAARGVDVVNWQVRDFSSSSFLTVILYAGLSRPCEEWCFWILKIPKQAGIHTTLAFKVTRPIDRVPFIGSSVIHSCRHYILGFPLDKWLQCSQTRHLQRLFTLRMWIVPISSVLLFPYLWSLVYALPFPLVLLLSFSLMLETLLGGKQEKARAGMRAGEDQITYRKENCVRSFTFLYTGKNGIFTLF